jgi:hypothetical protein
MLPSKLFTSLRGFFLFLLLLLISIDLSAQVVIKERVVLAPTNNAALIANPEDCFIFLLPRGGLVTIECIFCWGPYFNLLANGIEIMDTVGCGDKWFTSVSQWASFNFQLLGDSLPFNDIYCPVGPSGPYMWFPYGGFLNFCPCCGDTLQSAFAFGITLSNHDSSEAMPPQWYLDSEYGPGNPYDSMQAPTIELPFEMEYRVIIEQAEGGANDSLVLIAPEYQLLFDNAAAHIGDTVIIGPFEAGTQLKFGLISGVGEIVRGKTIYPGVFDYGTSWALHCEDWTDMDGNDVIVNIEPNMMTPDHLELWSTTETVYYGDTVDVEIVPVGIDSLFAPLGCDTSYEFSVALTGNTSLYGQLLYNGQSDTLFESIPSVGGCGIGVQFAANGIEPDSSVDLTFYLTATYIDDGGGPASIRELPHQSSDLVAKDKLLIVKPRKSNGPPAIDIQSKISKRSVVMQPDVKTMTMQMLGRNLPLKNIGRIGGPIRLKKKAAEMALISSSYNKTLSMQSILDKIQTKTVVMENYWKWGINPPQDILLGETIYFQAVADPTPTHEKRLFIIPLRKTSEKHDPQTPNVSFKVEKRDGDVLGVYYDENKDEDGADLRKDIIRLVGRYWKLGNENKYTVALTATTPGRSGQMVIEVKKPIKLIDWANAEGIKGFENGNDYGMTVDVFGNPNPLNIDSMVIKIAGEEGIPPQYIKGQMYAESFRGPVNGEYKFYPSYRYEPGVDYDIQFNKYKKNQYLQTGYPFVVTFNPNSMGGPLPANHTNVQPYDYQRYPVTISQYVGSRINQYYQRDEKNINRIKFLGKKVGEELTLRWETYYDRYCKYFLDYNSSLASSLSLTLVESDLIQGRVRPGFDIAAQTRIVASYGLLQMTHYTATDKKLNGFLKTASDKLPENLNDHEELMPAYVQFTQYNIKKVLGDSPPISNWTDGYEATWLKIAGWYNPLTKPVRYNPKYGKKVMDNSKLFLPQK